MREKGAYRNLEKTIQFVFEPLFSLFFELLPIMNLIKYLDFRMEKIINKNVGFQITSHWAIFRSDWVRLIFFPK